MTTASWSETVREIGELRLVVGIQQATHDFLQQFVRPGRDAEGKGIARIEPVELVVDGRVPAQRAGAGRFRVLGIQPGRPLGQDPATIDGRGRVPGGGDPAPLPGVIRAVPPQKKPILAARELRQLVKGNQVVGPALIFANVPFVLHAAEFDGPAVLQSPDALLRVVGPLATDHALRLVDDFPQLRKLPAEDDGLSMRGVCQPEEQLGLAGSGGTAKEHFVGGAVVGLLLRSR